MNCTYRSIIGVMKLTCCKWNKSFKPIQKKPDYIHYMTTDIEGDILTDNSSDAFEGRVKMMMKRQDKMLSWISKLDV